MCKRSVIIGALLACLPWAASAGPVTYNVLVDTSSISGTTGSLDFNFNPGPLVSQAASLQILNFASNGSLAASPTVSGDVSGVLPATLTFDNGAGFNDYFGGFTFGTTLDFKVSLYGPALSSPDGISTSGSTFAFSMFSDVAGTTPVLTTDLINGYAFIADVNLDGTTATTNFIITSSVPELNSFVLLGSAISMLGALLRLSSIPALRKMARGARLMSS